MSKLISCELNIDTACVELRYADGGGINIYCPGVEDSFDTRMQLHLGITSLGNHLMFYNQLP